VKLALVTTNTQGMKRLRKNFESMLTDLGMHQGLTERNLYLHEAIERRRDRASGGNARLAPTPRRRSSMSPARPTTSITSTSSTRASSRPLAR
jgi:hypothetical protein